MGPDDSSSRSTSSVGAEGPKHDIVSHGEALGSPGHEVLYKLQGMPLLIQRLYDLTLSHTLLG